MTKEEINKTIFSLQTDEEINDFVNKRIAELENNSKETTVGQNYTTTFKEYISQKTHYKPGKRLKDAECPDLVYDDMTPYINLVKSIKKKKWYNELALFSTIFFEIYNYLPTENSLSNLNRFFIYSANAGKRVSIKQISENECAFCAEKSGMAHNMFKFLGIDSEVVCGYRDSEEHAFNMVYPNGYGSEPMILYDPSYFVSFIKGETKYSLGYFKAYGSENYKKLMSGEPMKIDLTKTEKNYRQMYGFKDDFVFEGDTPTYIAGLDRKKEVPGVNITDEQNYSTHLENDTEIVSNKL